MTTKASKRGQPLTPDQAEQLENYWPLIQKMAYEWFHRHRRTMHDWTLEDWRSFFAEKAAHIAPCWEPGRGCFGTLLKVGLPRLGLNAVRDYHRPTRFRVRVLTNLEDLDSIVPDQSADVLKGLLDCKDQEECRDILTELQESLEATTNRLEQVEIVADFLLGLNPGWLGTQTPRTIANWLGLKPPLAKAALNEAFRFRGQA